MQWTQGLWRDFQVQNTLKVLIKSQSSVRPYPCATDANRYIKLDNQIRNI